MSVSRSRVFDNAGVAHLQFPDFSCKLCTPAGIQREVGMATDYDAPRKNDDEAESLDAIKERIPAKSGGTVDVDEADHGDGFALPEVVSEDIEVVVVPPQTDEFTCSECFIVKHRSMLAPKKGKYGEVCTECA